MMLRSSSTPLLGSLLHCSFSESPNNHHHHSESHSSTHKISFKQNGFLQNFNTNSSSPIYTPNAAGIPNSGAIRRARSEGNLEGLVADNHGEISISDAPHKFPRKPNSSVLQTIPSFSFHSSNSDEEEQIEENGGGVLNIPKRVTNYRTGDMMGGGFDGKIVELLEEEETEEMMYLARGLGVNGYHDVDFYGGGGSGGNGGGRDLTAFGYGRDGGDVGIGEHYKRMVEENPGNSLFLRNYAQYLYQSREDLKGAEEYYSRAILADPEDGEILSQYAKLIWELHRDEERATSYFERAVHAAPQDSHVQAAYASFLWETEEE